MITMKAHVSLALGFLTTIASIAASQDARQILEASGIKGGIGHILIKMQLKNKLGDGDEEETPRYMTNAEKTHYLLKKIDKKVTR